MSEIKLRSILRKDLLPLARSLFDITGSTFSIYDAAGQLMLGEPLPEPAARHEIATSDTVLGWVEGNTTAAALAALLSDLAIRAVEKKALGNEVLDKYREINLLYRIAAQFADCREVRQVAEVALAEGQQLIKGTSAVLMLLPENTQQLEVLLTAGEAAAIEPDLTVGKGIAGYVAAKGVAEIVNDVAADSRYGREVPGVRSLVCAPVQVQNRVIGVISIHHAEGCNYTAADLKLLTTIALQSASAIESALYYQREMAAAKAREARLQQQVKELQVKVDEAKRQREVAEITESDFFMNLKKRSQEIRKLRQ
jgi:transcriptional regulator with GAF, ATPase, and Fis domain